MKSIIFFAAAAMLFWSTASAATNPAHPDRADGAAFVPGEILIKAEPGNSLSAVAASIHARILGPIGDGSITLLDVGPGREIDAIHALGSHRGIQFAEPNWLRRPHAPNDPGFGLKWDLHNTGSLADGSARASSDADVDWLEAYDLLGAGFSGNATIAVIDTGIDPGHPDLDGKIVPGYDYLDNDGNPTDTYGHGTHVAGITLAETDNGTGTAGLAFGGQIAVMPLRVCDSGGCPTSAIVNAIYHAINNGADVINLSLGGRFGSSSEQQAIDDAWAAGLVIVASSGNDGAGKVSYPAAFSNAIATGSTDWNDNLAPYSNSGGDLDVVAPGGDMNRYHDPGGIYSTMPTYDVYLTTGYGYSKGYDQLQGTSMAAPQVSGLAGLIFAANPALTNVEVRSIIETTADDLGKSGWDRSFGYGRINAYNALLAATGADPGTDDPPTAILTDPADGATVSGTINIIATASDDSSVTGVAFYLDGNLIASDGNGSDGWSTGFDTTTTSDGSHTLTATATDAAGQTGSDSITVLVDNIADSAVSVLALTPDTIPSGVSTTVAISGSGFADGAALSLENGSGPAPTIDGPVYIDSASLSATITVKAGGPPRTRSWDVRVTNPDGSSGLLAGGLTILP